MYVARWGSSKWHKVARDGNFVCGGRPPIDRTTIKLNVLSIYEIRGFPRSACEGCFKDANMANLRRVTDFRD